MEMIKEYMNVKEAAVFLGCSPATINRKIRKGILKAYVLPGSRKKSINIEELKSALVCTEQPSTNSPQNS